MPSFDVVSEIDKQEIDNAVNQVKKEVAQRYDFRGSKTEINLEPDAIQLVSDDDYKVKAVIDVLIAKAVRRSVDPKALSVGKIEAAGGGLAKCSVKLVEGVSQDKGREIVKYIKESKLKVQVQIQDNQVRVTGKKRDDLQEVIALLKSKDFDLPLQFKNFRD